MVSTPRADSTPAAASNATPSTKKPASAPWGQAGAAKLDELANRAVATDKGLAAAWGLIAGGVSSLATVPGGALFGAGVAMGVGTVGGAGYGVYMAYKIGRKVNDFQLAQQQRVSVDEARGLVTELKALSSADRSSATWNPRSAEVRAAASNLLGNMLNGKFMRVDGTSIDINLTRPARELIQKELGALVKP